MPCALEVSQDQKSGPIGHVADLSLDGAFIASDVRMPVGTVMPLMMSLDDETDIKAEAEVVRVDERGMGLRFLSLSPKDSRRLRRYVVELSDAVGARENAQKLLDTDSHITRPIRNKARIQELLQTNGRYFLFPAHRSVRVEAKAVSSNADGVVLECIGRHTLKDGEPVICLYSHDFMSFSFRSTVLASSRDSVTMSLPAEVCYSERRSSGRNLYSNTATVSLKIPDQQGTESRFDLVESSASGFSFKAPLGQSLFSVGSAFPEMTLVVDGVTTAVFSVTVRHLTTMSEEDAEAWLRVGVSYNVSRSDHAEAAETLQAGDAGILSRVATASRNLKDKLAFVYHTRGPSKRGQDQRGHNVIRFTNRVKQPMVGVLDTTFDTSHRRVRAPLFIVAPGYGQRKETMSPLANTIVDHWRRNKRDIAVLRFDGTNNLGESYKDEGCTDEGRNNMRFTIPGAVNDLLGVLDWAKNNKYVDPTSITIFSVSMGAAAVRRVLSMPDAALVQNWISFMGAADVANAIMHGSGNIDIVGNYERGLKTGVIAIIGCLCDADHFCEVTAADNLLSLDHARADMAKVRANVTWFIGKHDAYMDPRRVKDLMSVSSPGKRQIIELDAGHVPRHGEEALAGFCLVTKHVWRGLYGTETSPAIPSRGWLAACEKREWDRVRHGMGVDGKTWWKDYLVGDNGIGFDIWSYTPEYKELVADQTQLVRETGSERVLDLGAGTGNMSESLLAAGVPRVVAADLVSEALDRLKLKAAAGNAEERLTTVVTDADGGPRVAMKRWVAGDLGTLSILASRLDPEYKDALARVASHYGPEMHGILRGYDLDVEEVVKRLAVPLECLPAISEVNRFAKAVHDRLNNTELANLGQKETAMLATCAGLPFPDGVFDTVVCSLVLSYMAFPDDTLFEIRRVLKPNGHLIISSMLPGMDSSKAYLSAINYVEKAPISEYPPGLDRESLLSALRTFADKSSKLVQLEEEGSFVFYSEDKLREMLQCAGFGSVSTKYSCGDPPLAVIASGTRR